MTCEFCIEGICRSKNETDCDWKSIKKDKDSIIKRMDLEREHILTLCEEIKKTTDWKEIKHKIRTIQDKILGLETMHTILDKEYKTYYKIEDAIFATKLATTLLHAKKIELKQKRRPK